MIFSKANAGTFSTSVLIQACGVVTGILTARLLGPAGRGELATIILWPTILSNLGLMGCNWVLAREVAANPQRESDWISSGLALGLATASLYFAAGYFLIPILLPADKAYLAPIARLCLWLIPLDVCNQMLLAVEHGRMRWKRFNLQRLSFFLIYLTLIVALGVTRRSQVRWFVMAFLVSQFLTFVIRLFTHAKSLAGGKVSLAESGRLVRAGAPYWGATVSTIVSSQMDMILVVGLFDTRAAGIYAVASACADGQSALGEALGITAFGVLSNESEPESRRRIISVMFRQSALASLGAGLAIACLIPFIVTPLFGAQFSTAARSGVILAVAASITASVNVLNQALRGTGRPHEGLASQLLGTSVLAAAALLFFRKLGLIGVAFAVLAGSLAQLLLLVRAAAKWLGIPSRAFWPFGMDDVRAFRMRLMQQAAALRLKSLRAPA